MVVFGIILGYAIQHGRLHRRRWYWFPIAVEMYHKVYLVAVGSRVIATEMVLILE